MTWERYAEPTLKESEGKGIFIRDPQVGLYYCFGRWEVTSAALTDRFPVPEGKKVVLATVILRDASAWTQTDPDASVLMGATLSGDPAFLGTLNEFDKLEPASLTLPNRVGIAIPADSLSRR